MMNKIIEFFKQSVTELKKVSWPEKDEVKDSTYIVLLTVLALALFLGFVDKVISFVIEKVIK
ncbi:MAG: preprotein translocase subunit SecE [bacterium]|nr:preprotein translocase subunit SecE [bacterium]